MAGKKATGVAVSAMLPEVRIVYPLCLEDANKRSRYDFACRQWPSKRAARGGQLCWCGSIPAS